MTLEYEHQRNPKIELLRNVLNCLPNWENLPHNFHIPAGWGEICKQLSDKTSREGREVGILGYLSSNKFQFPEIGFGKLALGDEKSVSTKKEGRHFLFFPSRPAPVEIHTHPVIRYKGKSDLGLDVYIAGPFPSGADLAGLLFSKERSLSFVVSSRCRGEPTDIDVLVKCQEARLINGKEEYDRVVADFKSNHACFEEKIKRDGISPYLADWKIFLATVAKAYGVGYYSSFNCLSVTHHELLSRRSVCLTRVYPYQSFDDFLARFPAPNNRT